MGVSLLAGLSGGQVFGLFLVFIVVVVVASCIRIVPQAYAYVMERLGTYQ